MSASPYYNNYRDYCGRLGIAPATEEAYEGQVDLIPYILSGEIINTTVFG